MNYLTEIKDRALEFYYRCYFRIKTPTSLSQVLMQFIPPRIVAHYNDKISAGELVKQLTTDFSLQESEILSEIASILDLGVLEEGAVPHSQLIELTGISEEVLRSCGVIPQPAPTSPARYALAISDPFVLDIKEYRRHGIQLLLSTSQEINALWMRYDNSKKVKNELVAESQIFAVLKQLAQDAYQLGAFEVFIGHPQENMYEFIAANKLYSGKLHPVVYRSLLSLFKDSFQLRREVDSTVLNSLSLSLTRSFERPVVCLCWEALSLLPKPIIEAVESAPKIQPVEQVQKHHVLLVDDDERFLLILAKILENKGWHVTTKRSGKEALAALSNNTCPPEVIVSDVHMPQMDGASFLKHLRDRSISTPVVMLTSDDDQLLEAELALLGADAFVRKQEDPRILLAWCNNLVNRRSHKQESVANEQYGY